MRATEKVYIIIVIIIIVTIKCECECVRVLVLVRVYIYIYKVDTFSVARMRASRAIYRWSESCLLRSTAKNSQKSRPRTLLL
jgi:hypothetical protein